MEELVGIMSHHPTSGTGTDSGGTSAGGGGRDRAGAGDDSALPYGSHGIEGVEEEVEWAAAEEGSLAALAGDSPSGRLTGERLPEGWEARFDLFLDTVRTRCVCGLCFEVGGGVV